MTIISTEFFISKIDQTKIKFTVRISCLPNKRVGLFQRQGYNHLKICIKYLEPFLYIQTLDNPRGIT